MSETSELWQIKLVLEFFSSRSHQERLQKHPRRGLFMSSEFLPVVKCAIDNTLDRWLQGERPMHVASAFLSCMFSWGEDRAEGQQHDCGCSVSS